MADDVKIKVGADISSAEKTIKGLKPTIDDSEVRSNLKGIAQMFKNMKPPIFRPEADMSELDVARDTVEQMRGLVSMSFADMQNSMNNLSPQELSQALDIAKEKVRGLQEAMNQGRDGDPRKYLGVVYSLKELKEMTGEALSKTELLKEALESVGGYTPPTMGNLSKEVDMASMSFREMGMAMKSAGEAGVKSFNRSTFSIRRMAFGMLGVQSMYSILSRASRQYMRDNEAMGLAMEGVTQAIGQALAPAIGFLINALQHLVRWLMIAIAYITTFINVIFGTNIAIQTTIKATGKASSGLGSMGKAAKKAGKQVEKAFGGSVAGIDELNVISSETEDNLDGMGSAVGGGGNGVDLGGALPDMSMFDISEHLAPLKKFGDFLERNKRIIQATIAVIVGLWVAWKLVTAAVTGWKILSGIMNPWMIVIALLIAAIVLIALNWDWVKEKAGIAIDWISTKFGQFTSWIKDKWNSFVDNWKLGWQIISDFFKGVIDWIVEKFQNGMENLGKFLRGFKEMWSIIWTNIKIVFSTVWEWIKSAFQWGIDILKKSIEGYKILWSAVWEAIKLVFSTIWEWIKTAFQTGVDFILRAVERIRTGWTNAWNGIKNTFSIVWNWIKSKAEALGNVFSSVWSGIGNRFKSVFEGIKTTFSNVWNWILGQFSKGGAIFGNFKDGVAGVFKSIVNGLITGINRVIATPFNAINRMINTFKRISILGAKPFGGLGTISVPSIPRFAGGHVGSQAQMGIFGEYVGARNNPELVTPESQMRGVFSEELDSRADRQETGGDLYIEIRNDNNKPIKHVIKDYQEYRRQGGKLRFE